MQSDVDLFKLEDAILGNIVLLEVKDSDCTLNGDVFAVNSKDSVSLVTNRVLPVPHRSHDRRASSASCPKNPFELVMVCSKDRSRSARNFKFTISRNASLNAEQGGSASEVNLEKEFEVEEASGRFEAGV